MEEHIGKRINHERTDQALQTGAKTIATGCPFCMTMMNDGIKDRGQEEIVAVKDIAEIIDERLGA
jgi:Fe-S oxidoreductase